MDGRNYVPPFRRRQGGDSGHADGEVHSSQDKRQNNRGRNAGRGHRGSGRGGRGDYQRDFYQKQGPKIDESDLRHRNDIRNYFSGSEYGDSHSSSQATSYTLHDSKDHPKQLSYVLLFLGSNPRWHSDQIIFAKSNLTMLPEYGVKKAERGQWETEANEHKHGTEVPKDKDATVASSQGIPAATAEDNGVISAPPIAASPGSEIEKQVPGTDKLTAGSKLLISSDSTESCDPAAEGPKPHLNEGHIQHDNNQGSAQTVSPGAEELKFSAEIGGEKSGKSGTDDTAEHGEQEYHRESTEAKEVVNNEAHVTPVPVINPSTARVNRLKYSDIRKEDEQVSAGPAPYTALDDRIRIAPASQVYSEPYPKPAFPVIAPIDYAPSNPHPVAIFEEHWVPNYRESDATGRFGFLGWFKISRVNILAPRSAELVRMLHQKWERKDRFGNVIPSRPRGPSAWDESLAMEWAVIKFEPLPSEDAPPPPNIEKSPRPLRHGGAETRSVNEILADMRLNDGHLDNSQEGDGTVKQKDDKVDAEVCSGQDDTTSDK